MEKQQRESLLIGLIKEGNRLAFNQLYELYWLELFNYSYKILSSKDLAEDVVQDVFLKIWVKREGLSISNIKSYLYNATRNNSISKIRKANFTELQLEIIEQLSVRHAGEEKVDLEDLEKEIDKAAKDLPQRCRHIFYLSRIKNYSIEEIANELNISKRTVENQISIALKHIRPQLTDTAVAVFLCLINVN